MNSKLNWLVVSLLSGLGAMLFTLIAVYLPSKYGLALFTIGAVVFLYTLWRNPAHRYRRLANVLIGAWLAIRAFPTINIRLSWQDNSFGHLLLENSPGAAFDVAAAVIISLLILADLVVSEPDSFKNLSSRLRLRIGGRISPAAGQQSNQVTVGDILGPNAQVTIHQQHGVPHEQIPQLMDQVAQSLSNSATRVPDAHSLIDAACELIKQGKVDAAIRSLDDLRTRYWDRCNARERYRLEANLGSAHEVLGDFEKAAECYFRAKTHQPNDHDAQSLEAAGHMHCGRPERALELADAILKEHPRCERALAVRLRALPPTTSFDELSASVPAEISMSVEVLAALTVRALDCGRFQVAEEKARVACGKEPHKPTLKYLLAAAILNATSAAVAVRQDHLLEPGESARLVEAHRLLTEALTLARSDPDITGIRYNRAEVLDLLGRTDEAETDFRAAREKNPVDLHVAFRYARFLFRQNKVSDTIHVLRPLTVSGLNLELSLFLASVLGDRGDPGDLEEAIQVLRGALPDAVRASEELRTDLVHALVFNLSKIDDSAGIATVISNLSPGFVSNAMAMALRAEKARLEKRESEAIALANNALSSLPEEPSPSERRLVADALTRLNQHADALSLLKPIVPKGILAPDSAMALHCAKECNDDEFILFFCESLRAANVWDAKCVEFEVNVLTRYHEIDEPVKILQEFLTKCADPKNARAMRVHLALIGLRSKRPALIEPDPGAYPPPDAVSPHAGRVISSILCEGPDRLNGVRYAYELLRRNFSSPDAHLALIFAMGIGEGDVFQISQPTRVDVGVAVKYRDLVENSDKWFIIEDATDPDGDRLEVGPDHPVARELLGKSVGDEFYLRRDPLQDRKGTIVAVHDKYSFRKFQSIHNWEDRFPDIPFARRYTMLEKSDGEYDFSIISRSVEMAQARGEQLRDIYQRSPMSSLSFAQVSNASAIESVLQLSTMDGVEIRCSQGVDAELREACDAFKSAQMVLIDPSAAATMFVTRFFRALTHPPFECVTSAGVVEELQALSKRLSSRAGGVATKIGGRHVFIPTNPDEVQRFHNDVSDFIGWLGAIARIEGGASLAFFPIQERSYAVTLFGQAAAECLALAKSKNALLWTDDLIFASHARDKYNVKRIWTQAVAISLARSEHVSPESLLDLSIQLVKSRYAVTFLTDAAILEAAKRSEWKPDRQPFSDVLAWLSRTNFTPLGAIALSGRALSGIWRSAPLLEQKQSATHGLVKALAQRPGGFAWTQALLLNIDSFFALDPISARHCSAFVSRLISRYDLQFPIVSR